MVKCLFDTPSFSATFAFRENGSALLGRLWSDATCVFLYTATISTLFNLNVLKPSLLGVVATISRYSIELLNHRTCRSDARCHRMPTLIAKNLLNIAFIYFLNLKLLKVDWRWSLLLPTGIAYVIEFEATNP